MPRIPLLTARGDAAVQGTPTFPRPTAEHFGAEAFRGASQFGQTIAQIDKRIRNSKQALQIVELSNDIYAGMANVVADAATAPADIQMEGPARLKRGADALLKNALAKTDSPVVRRAVQAWWDRAHTRGQIELATEGRKVTIGRQRASFQNESERLADLAASSSNPGEVGELLTQQRDLADQMLAESVITPDEHRKALSATTHRYWLLVAERDPTRILNIATGQAPFPSTERAEGEPRAPGEMDPVRLPEYVNVAQGVIGRGARQRAREEKALRQQENVRLYKKLQDDTLTAEEVLASKVLTRQDMDFFVEALKKETETIETDKDLAIRIEDLLDAPTDSPAKARQNARQAKKLAQDGWKQGKLKETLALSLMRRANGKLGLDAETAEMEKDRWWKITKRFLKEKLGHGGSLVGWGENKPGKDRYWEILEALMIEQESDPDFRGHRIFDKAKELVEPAAVERIETMVDDVEEPGFIERVFEFFRNLGGEEPSEEAVKGLEEELSALPPPGPTPSELVQLPDPGGDAPDGEPYTGRTLTNPDTGVQYRSTGDTWVIVEQDVPAVVEKPAPARLPALTGEVVGKTEEGKPVIRDVEGGVSSERTITVRHKDLHGGRWTNVPTIIGGKEVSEDEAVRRVIETGGTDPDTGKRLPSFQTREEAETAARARSRTITIVPSGSTGLRAITPPMPRIEERRPPTVTPAPAEKTKERGKAIIKELDEPAVVVDPRVSSTVGRITRRPESAEEDPAMVAFRNMPELVKDQLQRVIDRFRAGYMSDEEFEQLITFVLEGQETGMNEEETDAILTSLILAIPDFRPKEAKPLRVPGAAFLKE